MPAPDNHPRDPLHGITLETIVRELHAQYGWDEMAARIPVRCFQWDPSVKSSLTFLRKTQWARKRIEAWYADELYFKAREEKAAAENPENQPLPPQH